MINQHPYQRFYQTLQPALKNKTEELNLLGLKNAKENEVWSYLTQKKWKRPQEEIHIYELVNDIMTISSSQFMSFMTVEAYKAPNLFKELSSEEMKELLKG